MKLTVAGLLLAISSVAHGLQLRAGNGRIASSNETSAENIAPGAYLFRSIDGTGNHPSNKGAAGMILPRKVTDAYPDGKGDDMYMPDRPNPRKVSNSCMAQSSSHVNDRCLTNLVWLWGQFLDHDITLTPTGDEYNPIPIEDPSDGLYSPGGMPFTRSEHSNDVPRQMFNKITAFIDASNVVSFAKPMTSVILSRPYSKTSFFFFCNLQ